MTMCWRSLADISSVSLGFVLSPLHAPMKFDDDRNSSISLCTALENKQVNTTAQHLFFAMPPCVHLVLMIYHLYVNGGPRLSRSAGKIDMF